jgi:hypothetical protein
MRIFFKRRQTIGVKKMNTTSQINIHRKTTASTLMLAAINTISAALIIFVSVPAYAQKVSGVVIDDTFKSAERATTMVNITDTATAKFKDIKRAAISSFQVEFVTKGGASARSQEIGKKGSASTSMQMTLVGLTAADFQAITDKLHADFVKDLTAMNIEVVPTEKIIASAHYQKMAASGKVAPAETRTSSTWSTVYAPQGLGVYGKGSSSNAIGMFAGFSAFSEVTSTLTPNIELSKELDASLFIVRLVVNFVDMKSSDSSWFSRNSGEAKVSWAVGPAIAAGESSLNINTQGHNTNMTLAAPIFIDGAAFKEIKDTSSIIGNVGLAVLSLAIGGGHSSQAIEKEAVADPEKYRTLVGAGLGGVREMFMGKFSAAK